MSRDPSDKVSLTLRMPERLRQRIEDRANHYKRSLNMQVIADLEDVASQNDLIRARFGTEAIAGFMQALSSCFVLAQMQTGKAFNEDAETMERAVIAAQAILGSFRRNKDYPASQATADTSVGHAMDIARYAGMTFFHGSDIPEPDWLKAALGRMREEMPSPADEGK